MTENEKTEAVAAAVDEAIAESPTARRHAIEQQVRENDARIQALLAQKIAIDKIDIISVRLATLVEQLLGTIDDPRHLDYEAAVQAKMSAALSDIESQVRRATLLNGVHIVDPRADGHGRPQ